MFTADQTRRIHAAIAECEAFIENGPRNARNASAAELAALNEFHRQHAAKLRDMLKAAA